MRLTKYEHACVALEEQGKKLVIDPGIFSTSFTDLSGVEAAVITHIHTDHFDEQKIKVIAKQNPNVQLFTNEQVAKSNPDISFTVVNAGDSTTAGSFNLEFFGSDHELFADTKNIAVMVNGKFFHPGDSYTLPVAQVDVLAAPASAPWLRVTEASDFIKKAKATTIIPIHNALLSEIGESIHYRILGEAAASVGSKYKILKPGESIEI